MSEIPRKWVVSGNSDLPALPDNLRHNRIWVKRYESELHAVCAVNQDEGWAELLACDSDGKKLITDTSDGGMDVVRVRVHGKITQGIR
jgi:hypothetical protein